VDLEQLAIGREIKCVTVIDHPAAGLSAWGILDPLGLMHREPQLAAAAAHPQIVHGPIEQHVVAGTPLLQLALAARDVSVQRRHIAEDRVTRVRLGRRVEQPPRPGCFLRGKTDAVVVDAVDAVQQQIV
jgi:hypothetical protein